VADGGILRQNRAKELPIRFPSPAPNFKNTNKLGLFALFWRGLGLNLLHKLTTFPPLSKTVKTVKSQGETGTKLGFGAIENGKEAIPK
jgi:hypothetical protein